MLTVAESWLVPDEGTEIHTESSVKAAGEIGTIVYRPQRHQGAPASPKARKEQGTESRSEPCKGTNLPTGIFIFHIQTPEL